VTLVGDFKNAILTSPAVNKSITIGGKASEPKTDDGKSGDTSASGSTPKSTDTSTAATATTSKSKSKAKPKTPAATPAPTAAPAQSDSKTVAADAAKPAEPVDPGKVDVAMNKIATSAPINLGNAESVFVKIKNNSSVAFEGCEVTLSSEDGFSEKQTAALKKNELKSVKFVWTPGRLGGQKLNAAFTCKGDETPDNNQAEIVVQVVEKPVTSSKSTGALKQPVTATKQ
jgi:hypothetical protein